ncbi:calcium and integrin-binding protein, putative [Pediculus humanus corporis]|uniref:Calcium and integrin-binding protein, putative n=1 Tax=Pediculus humanus subsp. corporis TaxID=121224 RepID=E0VH31_PEDHC|nr:calcium and integrin-binding protein, putative [Pediculus humanus corporis]EEB12687.1 calcium and integrin-binding protein, putative [Pediculus humanus corporis]
MSFEDMLDLASAFSEDCPIDVKGKWAFLIFDFDEDNLINGEDIVEIVNRLTMKGLNDENDGEDLGEDEKKKVAEIILNDTVLCNADGITCVEFINILKKIPEFLYAFRIKFL